MKEFTKLVVFILLFYSCKENLNEPKQENINSYYQQPPLDISPIFDNIDSSRIPVLPALPPTEGVAIDADLQIPDTTKFQTHTGWKLEYTFEQTMNDLLQYWRDRVNSGRKFLRR